MAEPDDPKSEGTHDSLERLGRQNRIGKVFVLGLVGLACGAYLLIKGRWIEAVLVLAVSGFLLVVARLAYRGELWKPPEGG